jgi:hypothetical protein
MSARHRFHTWERFARLSAGVEGVVKRSRAISVIVLLGLSTAVWAQFGGFRSLQTPPITTEVNPSDAKHEFAWSRLRYDSGVSDYGGYGGFYGFGRGGGAWSRDYPKADITFLAALRRLTRIDARSYQQVVDINSDDLFNYPFLYAVQGQAWTFNEAQAKRLREFLLKGGFLMVDDFHGTVDWEHFLAGMRLVLPAESYPISDLNDDDEIFHVLYDIGHRIQVPGEQYVSTGRTYEKDGYVPKWRVIRDSKGRIIVAICHNMHLGDAWEWADDAEYPEEFASMAFRVGIDYVMYSMTH